VPGNKKSFWRKLFSFQRAVSRYTAPMHWLQSFDMALFHLFNGSLNNPFFDGLVPIVKTRREKNPSVFCNGHSHRTT
jgi:hypothetical protein